MSTIYYVRGLNIVDDTVGRFVSHEIVEHFRLVLIIGR